MAKSMEIVPSGELQKQFGRYSDEAMIRPVGVSRNGRVRFVMVPVDEYCPSSEHSAQLAA